jgi:DNA-binding NtrC family response regulator
VPSQQTVTKTNKPLKGARGDPCLFVALQCERPREGGARFALAGVQAVAIGRAPRMSIDRGEQDGARVARLGIPDPRMSAEHARLQRVLGSWMISDTRSKNGTFCDGARVERAPLRDGALLELGHTFFVFREALFPPSADAIGRAAAESVPGFVTFLPALAAELDRLRRVARSALPILLQGETGTGKEVVARALHALSGRTGPFQAVNCGAIAPDLVDSELFGHRRGSYTGAIDDQPGLLRSADGGTLLLDEIGDLPPPAQAALLRALQEGEVLPVGAAQAVKVDVRVLAATHRDLDALCSEQRFRPDLLGRLSGYRCVLPPLRERREDFALLAAALLESAQMPAVTLSLDAARALLRHRWPLNVRELQKCLSGAALLAAGGQIELDHLPESLRAAPTAARPAGPKLDADAIARRDELISLLGEEGGNVSAVARRMGKARTQVQRWMHRFQLDPLSFRK